MDTRYQKQLAIYGEAKTERESALEETYGDTALTWVKNRNRQTLQQFSQNQTFQSLQSTILAIREDKQKITPMNIRDGFVYEFRKDKTHSQGVWRRTPLQEYKKPAPVWETLLDLNALPEVAVWKSYLSEEMLLKNPHGSWVWAAPITQGEKWLVGLSYGGGDGVVYREFDMQQKKFVEDGFATVRGDGLHWCDDNSLWVTDYDHNHLTASGYATRIIKHWKRGDRLEKGKVVYHQTNEDDIWSEVDTYTTPQGRAFHILTRCLDFHRSDYFLLDNTDFALQRVDIPHDAAIETYFHNNAIFTLKKPWECANGKTYAAGSVLSIDLSAVQDHAESRIGLVFEPTNTCVVNEIKAAKDYLVLSLLNNINGEAWRCYFNKTWRKEKMALPTQGQIEILSCKQNSNHCLIEYENYTSPPTYYYYDLTGQSAEILKKSPATFDGESMVTHQYWATSQDGTHIPYYAVHQKSLTYNGNNPTVLNAYGGFGDSLLPEYARSLGKCWLEQGGVFLYANIRGGGEFGPRWHQAALQENRHKSFEDFIAVAEDAIRRGITSPGCLGIRGASNGGLLVGVAMTQRPDLFQAVVCDVPLLDMLNYASNDLNGKGWIAEYGDPAKREMRRILQSYSPYHTVSKYKQYPEVLFLSSTEDDRVHPGHARKMVDRMLKQGHKVYYYESSEGGHLGESNLRQDVFNEALVQSYLHQKLMAPKLQLVSQPSERAVRHAKRHAFFKANDNPVETQATTPDENNRVRKRQRVG